MLNWEELRREAAKQPGRALRRLTGCLYSAEPELKWDAVRALGRLAGEPGLLSEERLRALLERYFWALNDESGAVPYGIPEAIGEILARRPELRPSYLALLCSHAHQEDIFQSGPVLEGVFWALGRVGPPVAACDAEAVEALRRAAAGAEEGLRQAAAQALERVLPPPAP